MCGIFGWFGGHGRYDDDATAAKMSAALRHRGPDDDGVWSDVDARVTLGHRRLAIVDLSSLGHQPMTATSGRYVIVFNGEIYNHLALRQRLEASAQAPAWRGHSDTETLLACIDAWGLEGALQACVGMFAFALWDRAEKVLSLARDRFGEKPLYYGWQNGLLLFGSELKAIAAHPAFDRRVNRDAVALLLQHNYIPTPYSIWQGISKLPAGTYLTARADQQEVMPKAYWSLHDVATAGLANPLQMSDEAATDALESVLREAIGGQMIADVPLGALLSGGVDSSTVVALMQVQSARPVKTFSIGFHEKEFDESAHAAAVARHLGTDHTALFMSARDVLDAVPRMPSLYDEPFADSSQLPTSLVMALARQHVTVALSGDGGDELFGGYNRYLMARKLRRVLRLMPQPLRAFVGRLLTSIPASRWNSIARPLAGLLNQAAVGDKLHKLGNRLEHVRTLDDLYLALVTEWRDAETVVLGASHVKTMLNDRSAWPRLGDPISRMMALDALTYMQDDILVKVDRAAMGVSLETRAPFLDHRVADMAWHLPMKMKIRGGHGKWLLRQVLYRHVPRELIDRPKVGFGIPLDSWLRGPLRDWAEALLDPLVLSQQGYFDVAAIRHVWQQHLSGANQYGYRLWSVLMFQAWLAEAALPIQSRSDRA